MSLRASELEFDLFLEFLPAFAVPKRVWNSFLNLNDKRHTLGNSESWESVEILLPVYQENQNLILGMDPLGILLM